jgi:excisionase family DNA binding protein
VIKGQLTFLRVKEAASYLGVDVKYINELIAARKIPCCVLPNGVIRFWPESLKDWALSYERSTKLKNMSMSTFSLFAARKIGDLTKPKTKYVGITTSRQKVYAQIHYSLTQDPGIGLALRECGTRLDLPKHTLKSIPLNTLSGYWRTNRSWLCGERWTTSPAAAFEIPLEMQDEKHPEWKVVRELGDFAKNLLLNNLCQKGASHA